MIDRTVLFGWYGRRPLPCTVPAAGPSFQVARPGQAGDGMGARLIEEAGFHTGFVSGSSVSAMRLAMDLVSFSEMAEAVESCIAAAPNVLWLADGDTGHGNALAVQKIIRAYARRGAAAVLIEDKIWPRPLGREGAKLVVEREQAILRCRAAVEAPCSATGLRPRLPNPALSDCAAPAPITSLDVAWERAFNSGQHVGPRLFASGYFLTTTGGHFMTSGHALEVDGPDGWVKAIREQIKNGVARGAFLFQPIGHLLALGPNIRSSPYRRSFHTGITAYLEKGGTLENAQLMAAYESPRTTKLYDRTGDEITLDEVERITI